jgi:hypothetical protein
MSNVTAEAIRGAAPNSIITVKVKTMRSDLNLEKRASIDLSPFWFTVLGT